MLQTQVRGVLLLQHLQYLFLVAWRLLFIGSSLPVIGLLLLGITAGHLLVVQQLPLAFLVSLGVVLVLLISGFALLPLGLSCWYFLLTLILVLVLSVSTLLVDRVIFLEGATASFSAQVEPVHVCTSVTEGRVVLEVLRAGAKHLLGALDEVAGCVTTLVLLCRLIYAHVGD